MKPDVVYIHFDDAKPEHFDEYRLVKKRDGPTMYAGPRFVLRDMTTGLFVLAQLCHSGRLELVHDQDMATHWATASSAASVIDRVKTSYGTPLDLEVCFVGLDFQE